MTWVKICGITSRDALEAAVGEGASAVGFVFEPGSPRYVGNRIGEVRSWLDLVPEGIERVAVVGEADNLPSDLEGFTAVQWVAGVPRAKGLRRIKAHRLSGSEPPPTARDADFVLLDAFHRGAWGGTGTTVDWAAAAAFARDAALPVVLAGGLTPENVAAALRAVHPFGVDVSSGLESSPGVKDVALIRAFIRAARRSG
ncbi:MAG: N-(5'-phosphoribosyl)anthranilate isomerase [Armatimonadota bacterium]